MSDPITIATPVMEATRCGIPVTAIGDHTAVGYLALGHHDPTTTLAAMTSLDSEVYGDLDGMLTDSLLDLIGPRWARFTACECGLDADGDGCYHAWVVDWHATEETPGAVAAMVLDLTTDSTTARSPA